MQLHQWDPEAKLKYLQCKHKESLSPKTICIKESASVVMASIFCAAKGILLIGYLTRFCFLHFILHLPDNKFP